MLKVFTFNLNTQLDSIESTIENWREARNEEGMEYNWRTILHTSQSIVDGLLIVLITYKIEYGGD